MKKMILAGFLMGMVAVLSACNVNNGDGSTTTQSSTQTPDLTFVNVNQVGVTTVVPGQRNIEAAAFRMEYDDTIHHSIGQLVFSVNSTVKPSALVRDLRIMNGENDISQKSYFIGYDDVDKKITVDFYAYPWLPNDFGTVPNTYSVVVGLNPDVPAGTSFSLTLKAVQMHDAGLTVAIDAVQGATFSVASFNGLPIVTTSSSSSAAMTVGAFGLVGTFTAECPESSQSDCVLDKMTINAGNMYGLVVNAGGAILGTIQECPQACSTFEVSNPYVPIPPGQAMEFTIDSTALSIQGSIQVSDIEFGVYSADAGWVEVNPMSTATCNQLVSTNGGSMGCKGKPTKKPL